MEKIVQVGMPAEQVESLMQVKLSQVRIELQTHFEAEVANVLQNCFPEQLPQAQAQLRCMKKRSKRCSKKWINSKKFSKTLTIVKH